MSVRILNEAEASEHAALLKCRRCPALRHQFAKLRMTHPGFWNLPVVPSGPSTAPLLIVGLAPGLHGANRTGVPFEGDASGNLLQAALERLNLVGQVRITNVLKCLPRQNKPTTAELNRCHGYIDQELTDFTAQGGRAIFAVGRVAHERVLKALGFKQSAFAFGHGAVHELAGPLWLIDTYHCSRYNTQTGRITSAMFEEALSSAARLAVAT
ncbi:MAG: uracil-DNA glycosylase family protein [Pseudomonadales bacterium]|nr:uracil-DNA glycosylase family protein [Pseudomonadales bacterium]